MVFSSYFQLETVVGYEHRRRIRTQIRLVKKSMETTSTTKSSYVTKERARSPEQKKIETTTVTTTTTKKSSRSPTRTVTKTEVIKKEGDAFVSRKLSTKSDAEPTSDKPIWASKNILKKTSENLRTKTTPSTPKSQIDSRQFTRTTPSATKKVTEVDSITSSYGIGPTDEDGKPIFGLRALKKSHAPKPEAMTSSTHSSYHETRTLVMGDEDDKIREEVHRETTRRSFGSSSQMFIDQEIACEDEEVEHSQVKSFLNTTESISGIDDVISRMKNADNGMILE